MKIGINRLHYPVTALGPGRRIGIWVQGCSIGCAGCASTDTWAAVPERLVEVAEVIDRCAAILDRGEAVDGVTISGGEPFQQPEALAELLDSLDAWRSDRAPDIDLLCYSGLPWAKLQLHHAGLLARLDAVITEPFIEGMPTDASWRGSANQRLIPLSEKGEQRYRKADRSPPRMQVAVENGEIWFIGVPRRGDLDRILEAGRRRGIEAKGPSWRS
jgi:anaerobic ribonucleoside-triphosphate reductase activating protein